MSDHMQNDRQPIKCWGRELARLRGSRAGLITIYTSAPTNLLFHVELQRKCSSHRGLVVVNEIFLETLAAV